MPKLIGPKRIIALAGIAGAAAYWQVRSRRRRQEEMEWEAEVMGAIDEGRRAGEAASQQESGGSTATEGTSEARITISDSTSSSTS